MQFSIRDSLGKASDKSSQLCGMMMGELVISRRVWNY